MKVIVKGTSQWTLISYAELSLILDSTLVLLQDIVKRNGKTMFLRTMFKVIFNISLSSPYLVSVKLILLSLYRSLNLLFLQQWCNFRLGLFVLKTNVRFRSDRSRKSIKSKALLFTTMDNVFCFGATWNFWKRFGVLDYYFHRWDSF